MLEPSKAVLKEYLDKQKSLWGTLFGEQCSIEYGEQNGIDEVLYFLKTYVTKVA
jgi:hypothetical protein